MDLALQPARPGWRVTPTQVVLAGLLYFLTARASLALIAQPTAIAAIWPPSGLLLGLLLLAAVDSWALLVGAVAVAITLANLLAGNGPLVSAGFAVANCAESLLAASLVRAVHPAPLTMTRLRHVSVLFVVAVVGSNAVTALLGAAVAALALGAPFWGAWLGWWVADGLGMLLVGAAILALANPRRGAAGAGRGPRARRCAHRPGGADF
jgi:integral membrane sensor domain MASE1